MQLMRDGWTAGFTMSLRVRLRVLQLLALCELIAGSIASSDPGWLVPSTVEQLIGGDFNISCTINETYFQKHKQIPEEHCTVDQLYFQTKFQRFRSESDIRILNRTTIIYTARNVTEQKLQYDCMCGVYVINSAKVYVGTSPLKIEDFNCIGHDYYYMVCNFTEPYNELLTKYNVSYTVGTRDSAYRYYIDCNFDVAPIVTCNITDTKEQYKKYGEWYFFRLDIANSFGQLSQTIPINNYERTVPSKPGQKLSVVNRTESSLCLSWEMPRRSNYGSRGLVWQVLVRPKEKPIIQRPNWRNNSSEVKDTLCLTELPYAGYDYELTMRVRANYNQSMWSEPLIYEFQTLAERPRRPPRITNGSHYVLSSEKELRFYWEQLEPHEYNGPNFHYEITEYRINGTLADPSDIDVSTNSAKIKKWDKYAYHDILIGSRNSVNSSVNATRLVIGPVTDEDLSQRVPKNIRSVYHPTNRSYTLSWEAPDDRHGQITDYTVFWCAPKPAIQTDCDGSMHFEQVPNTARQFTTMGNQMPSLNMAVSANYVNHNTGMRWLICTQDMNDDLAKMQPTIDAATKSTLVVKWSNERVCPVILSGYNLTYCQRSTGKPDNCTTVVIRDRYAKQYEIRDLVPYTDYSVKMLMFSKSTASKYSDELVNRTAEAAPSPPRQLIVMHNVSNSMATLAWRPPIMANGVVRSYEGTFHYNNQTDFFKIPAAADELVNNDKLIYYDLGNLSAYTEYEVYVRACTLYNSEPSNLVNFQTTVGVPSKPEKMNVTLTDSITKITWFPPTEPAGRIDFYELSFVGNNHNNSVLSCMVNYILPTQSRYLAIPTPKCKPNSKQEYRLRAINAELLQNEITDEQQQQQPQPSLATLTSRRDNCQLDVDNLSEEEQQQMRLYYNQQRYRLYTSDYLPYGLACSDSTQSAKYQTIEVVVAIIVLGVLCHMVYKKYRKMSDIELVLPPGITENLKKPMDMGGLSGGYPGPDSSLNGLGSNSVGGIICTRVDATTPMDTMPHDFNSCGGSESSKLLLRNNSTSGGAGDAYDDHNDVMVTPSVHQELSTVAPMIDASDGGNSYMIMRHGLPEQAAAAAPITTTPLPIGGNPNGGYIKPTQMKNWPQASNNANTLPSSLPTQGVAMPINRMPLGGYVPVPILQSRPSLPPLSLPQQTTAPQQPPPAAAAAPPPPFSSTNYVQVSDLHKMKPPPNHLLTTSVASAHQQSMQQAAAAAAAVSATATTTAVPSNIIQTTVPTVPVNNFGYTTMEQLQLMKANAAANQQTRHQPQIGGYVTPQDLNALAHNNGHVI
ncbi:cytokine receptor [Drosophila willistoni]|nr:cytokine receptor [Drosophila willistoni]XP_023032651.1 cytokine receptor [Drosophila willistoni]